MIQPKEDGYVRNVPQCTSKSNRASNERIENFQILSTFLLVLGRRKPRLLSMSQVSVENDLYSLELAGDKRSLGGPGRWPKSGESVPSVFTPLLFPIILLAEGIIRTGNFSKPVTSRFLFCLENGRV